MTTIAKRHTIKKVTATKTTRKIKKALTADSNISLPVRAAKKIAPITDGKKAAFPKTISPMLATLVDKAPDEEGWIYEIKWDGYRAVALCNKKEVNIISRNNKPFNDKFYPVYQALQKLQLNAVLDGEIAVLKDTGITNFGALQNWRSEADGELVYYVFDILWINGNDVTGLSLTERRSLLKQLIPQEGIIRESESFNTNAADFLQAAETMGLEGMIAKRADSVYKQGHRGHDWLKIKVNKRHEVVIGGYTKNDDSPKPFSSLLVGVYDKEGLQYTGKIGTGFNDKLQKEMVEKFSKLEIKTCPFTFEPDVNKPSRFRPNPPHATAIWLDPKLVCEVSYAEITSDGVMRHPSFEGMREDKEAKNVHAEKAEEIPLRKSKTSTFIVSPLKKGERKTLLNPTEETQVKSIHSHEIKFGNLSKLYWPNDGFTKRDMLNYYYQVAPYILPYLKNRPQSLNRFPNGINGHSFYQKDVTAQAPEWIKKFPYHTSEGEDKNFLVVQDEEDLLWMANLGAIEMNPWNSTIQKPDHPDWCIIDLDPTDKNTFEQVIQTAQVTKQVLDSLNVKGYPKTSGSTGIHIYIPMGTKYTYDQCQLFGRMIATQVHQQLPKFTSIERLTTNRKGKIYVDFLQNRPKATLAAPYSVRPKPGATVSMPLHWDEVKKGLQQKHFTIQNAMQRIKEQGDLYKPVLGKGVNLDKLLKAMAVN